MNSEIDPKGSEMSDLAIANGIIADTFDLSPGRRSIVIGLALSALKRLERALGPEVIASRPRPWTERRVRSIVDMEARRIDAYEIADLEQIRVAEARRDYQRSTARAARLAAFLSHRDEAFHGPEVEAQVALARGMDCPGDHGFDGGAGSARPVVDHQQQRAGRMAGTRNRDH